MSPTRNTPLTARSVLASVLLGTDPPWLPTPLLVRTTALFGITEGSTRTALSRMVAAGEAVASDGGYRLVGPPGRPPATPVGQPPGRRPGPGTAPGSWPPSTATRAAPAADRADAPRRARRAPAGRAPRGRRGAGPTTSTRTARPTRPRGGRRWCVRWTRRPPRSGARRRLGAVGTSRRGRRRARTLRDEIAGLLRAARARRRRRPGATASSLSAAVLRHLQADPLLPDALLPSGWPGAALRAEYDRYDTAYRPRSAAWFRAAR